MIISISGKIGSGKDTVGRIVQYLKDKKLMGYTHPPTELDFKSYSDNGHSKKSIYKIKKFASKLKQMASILLGLDTSKFEDQEFKKTNLGKQWGNMTVREFLQKLGTDAMRMGLHENVWVNALFSDYKAYSKGKAHNLKEFSEVYTHEKCVNCKESYNGYKRQYLCKECIEDNSVQFYPDWIITDTRFPNELKAVEERGGLTIKVLRPETDCLVGDHPSETALDNATFDYVIVNDGSIQDLIKEVEEVLIQEGII